MNKKIASAVLLLILTLPFQNCSEVNFVSNSDKTAEGDPQPLGEPVSPPSTPQPPQVCGGISCELTPLTDRPAVTTILIALGDETNSQVVVNGASAQLIAESVIRYSSPKAKPKILLVQDQDIGGEDPEDTVYVRDVLLARYDVTYMAEPAAGLRASDLMGYDVVWFNNPGYPMSSVETRDTLLAFNGAVVLQGDDLSRGNGFSLDALTGLTHVDNGTEVSCGGTNVSHNNNSGEQFRVKIDSSRISGTNAQSIEFRYGNDIDNTSVTAGSGVEVMASARGGPQSCTEERPAIVRRLK